MSDVDRKALRKRIEALSNLPTLSNVVEKLNLLVDSPDTSIGDVGKVISKDQVLSAKVLKLINSGFYGFPGRITTVTHALVLLGFNVVKGLILSATVYDLMKENMIGLWEHSLGTAVASGLIARRLGEPDPEEVATGGLLHDLGKVALGVQQPDLFTEVMEAVVARDCLVMEAEQHVLGVNHARIAYWLIDSWNLPSILTEAVIYHHQPQLAKVAPRQTAMVHLGDIFARARGFGNAGDPYLPPIEPAAWELLDLTMEDVRELARDYDAELDLVANIDFG